MGLIAGGGTKVINCEIGDQIGVAVCERIRDDLEANAFFLSDGRESMLLINCDLTAISREFILEVLPAIEEKVKMPSSRQNIIICCTHTHEGPRSRTNPAYWENVKSWLIELAENTVASARPAKLGWASGSAHIGYNRRTCWRDNAHNKCGGTHEMYGDARKPGFTGIEGPDDPAHTILFAVDEKNEVIALAHNNSCHAVCLYGSPFASSDFPGEARSILRNAIGSKLPVLYLQGASGDTDPKDQLHPERRVNGKRRAKEIGALLAAETLSLMYKAEMSDDPILKSAGEDLKVNVRIPDEEEMKEARRIIEMGEEKAGWLNYMVRKSVLRLHSEFAGNKAVEVIPIHTFRIGSLAIATNSCELYCQFGLDIKRRSPANMTMVVQLANGNAGYCPTIYGIIGGGYSGMTAYGSRLEPYAGYKIVETSSKLLSQLWER